MMSDDFDEMSGMPPCPACHESVSGFCAKHSAAAQELAQLASDTGDMLRKAAGWPEPSKGFNFGQKVEVRPLPKSGPTAEQILSDIEAKRPKQDPLEAAAEAYAKLIRSDGLEKSIPVGIPSVYAVDHHFKAGAAWAYANPKASEAVDAYIAKVFPCTPPCNSYGVCDNCCDAKLIRVGSQLAANPPSPQVSVEDARLIGRLPPRPRCHKCGLESLTGNVHEPDCPAMTSVSVEDEAREYAGGMFDECQSASEAIHNARAKGRYDGFLAGHASGRRGGEAEVAELSDKLTAERNELLENESKMNGALSAKQEIINGLNEDLAEARAELLIWAKEQPDFLANETRLKNERDTLKSQLTQAQADVAVMREELEHLVSVADEAMREANRDGAEWPIDDTLVEARIILARVKGRS